MRREECTEEKSKLKHLLGRNDGGTKRDGKQRAAGRRGCVVSSRSYDEEVVGCAQDLRTNGVHRARAK